MASCFVCGKDFRGRPALKTFKEYITDSHYIKILHCRSCTPPKDIELVEIVEEKEEQNTEMTELRKFFRITGAINDPHGNKIGELMEILEDGKYKLRLRNGMEVIYDKHKIEPAKGKNLSEAFVKSFIG